VHYADSFCYDFARFVLLRTLHGVYSYSSSAKLDSLEIISGAVFRIIGLTKIPKIEFLPLDWIYRSIRINTVYILVQCKHNLTDIQKYDPDSNPSWISISYPLK